MMAGRRFLRRTKTGMHPKEGQLLRSRPMRPALAAADVSSNMQSEFVTSTHPLRIIPDQLLLLSLVPNIGPLVI